MQQLHADSAEAGEIPKCCSVDVIIIIIIIVIMIYFLRDS